MRPPLGLRGRLTLAALAALALAGLLAGGALLAAIERDGRAALDEDLAERAEGLRAGVLVRPGPRGGRGPRGDRGLLAGAGTFVQVALGGTVIDARGDLPAELPPLPAGDGYETLELGGEPWRALTVTRGPGGVRVRVAGTLAPVEARVARTRRLVLALSGGALLLTGLAAWGFASLAVRPLARLRAGAAGVSEARDLGTPLPEDDGPEEVRALARTLNAMLARLRASSERTERALEATRRFAADAGHELRTPLAGLRANLDALARNPGLPEPRRAALLCESAAEQERMVHLLEGLQALARGEAAERLPREPVDLGDVLEEAVHAARRRHPGITIALRAPEEPLVLQGWADGLRLLAENLLANAALHGRPHGRVEVALARRAGEAVLTVADDGPGVPPDERAAVLEPFARGAAPRGPGSGLGLAIVAQQTALHGGSLALEEAEALGGLAVEVRFSTLPAPAADRDAARSPHERERA